MILVFYLATLIQLSFCSKKQDVIFEISNALHRTLDYMVNNMERIDLQGYFGIVRAKALLMGTNLNRLDDKNSLLVLDIHRKTDFIMNMRRRIMHNKPEWVLQILEYDLWRKNMVYRYLKNDCPILFKNVTSALLNQLSNEAQTACITPDMFEFCMSNMYDTKKLSITGKLYGIQQSCKYFLLDTYFGIGYETTHRLLYIQISREWVKKIIFYDNFVQDICLNIYDQALATMGRGPFFDLFLEQIFLCGVEGYMEFLNMKWLKTILNNQLSDGCFSLNLNNSNSCSEHATGLATATLSLHIHFISNSRFTKECN